MVGADQGGCGDFNFHYLADAFDHQADELHCRLAGVFPTSGSARRGASRSGIRHHVGTIPHVVAQVFEDFGEELPGWFTGV